jgi:Spy/CpxP family protein refolding chaperone
MKRFVMSLALVGMMAPLGVVAAAPRFTQGRGGAAAPAADGETVSPGEIQRMFDAYALMQAQEQLKIGDDQFSQFLTRYKALQDIRRKGLGEHARIVNEMRKALNSGTPDDAVLSERLKAIQEIDARVEADIRKAYESIDQVLNVQQQAKFRVFEENMERRKLDLVTRARQANRPKPQ